MHQLGCTTSVHVFNALIAVCERANQWDQVNLNPIKVAKGLRAELRPIIKLSSIIGQSYPWSAGLQTSPEPSSFACIHPNH